jgi:oxygen-dependent protoporphyrinogen oxidase
MNGKKIAVVGAGISGLVAAYELKKAGFNVTVFEKGELPGGRMMTLRKDEHLFDVGADFLIDKYTLLKSYAKELGVKWQPAQDNGMHRIMRNEKAYHIDLAKPSDILTKFNILSFSSRVRFLLWAVKVVAFSPKLDFFNLSENGETYDNISAADYLAKHVSREVSDYVADPFTSIMQFHRADEISATALFALLQMMTSHGGFKIEYTPGGIGSLPQALAQRLTIRYKADVMSVEKKGGKVEIICSGASELFDAAIVATTGNVTQKIVHNLPQTAHDMFEKLSYASTISVAFTIPSDLFRDGTHLTYVPFLENSTISGYDNQIRKNSTMHKNGTSLLVVYLHEAAARKMLEKNMSDAEIFEIVKKELLKVTPEATHRKDEIAPHDLHRWPHAMPKFMQGYVSKVRTFLRDGQGTNNIFLAGDYLNSAWTEGAARCGKRVAEQIIEKITP